MALLTKATVSGQEWEMVTRMTAAYNPTMLSGPEEQQPSSSFWVNGRGFGLRELKGEQPQEKHDVPDSQVTGCRWGQLMAGIYCIAF